MKAKPEKKETAQNTPKDELEQKSPEQLAEETFTGDLMDCVLNELRIAQKPWQQFTEKQQREAIDRIFRRVHSAVVNAVKIIASRNLLKAYGSVEQVVFKGGAVKCVLTGRGNGFHELADRTDQMVMIVIPDVDDLLEQGHDIKPDPDQGALPLEADKEAA